MKIVKVVLSVLLIFASIGGFLQAKFLPSIFAAILGILLIPWVTEKIKNAFNHWNNRIIRYMTYGLLFFSMGATAPKTNEENVLKPKTTSNTKNFKKTKKKRIINLDDKYWDANGKEIKPSKDDITYRVIDILKHSKSGTKGRNNASEHMHLLIETSSYEKNILREIAEKIKDRYITFAPEQYNIDFWDNKKAYLKYLEREEFFRTSFDNLMKEFKKNREPIGDKHQELKLNWDKKNYPFIADHYPASISFDNKFYFYPFQNEHYIEVGGENSKK